MKLLWIGLFALLGVLGVVVLRGRGFSLYRALLHPRISRARQSFFDAFPISPTDTVFLGDSLTEGAEWEELFPGAGARNRGIGGDRVSDLLGRLGPVLAGTPRRLFLQIGTNDLAAGRPPDAILDDYATLVRRVAVESPATRVYVQSLLPRAASYRARIEDLNVRIARLAGEHGAEYLDLYPHFLGDDGGLRGDLHYDGLHLSGAGYRLWQRLLEPIVRG